MTFNPKPLDLSLWDKRSQLTWLKNPACSNPVRNATCYKNLTVSLMEGGPGAWVLTYTRILSCRRGSADADIYRRKAWQHSTTAWWNGFCSCRVFLLKSSPGVFLWPVPPPPQQPNSAPAFTPHLGAISRPNVRLLYTPTHNAWGLAGRSTVCNTTSYRCECAEKKVDQCKKVNERY